jgi:hypothetical protein
MPHVAAAVAATPQQVVRRIRVAAAAAAVRAGTDAPCSRLTFCSVNRKPRVLRVARL